MSKNLKKGDIIKIIIDNGQCNSGTVLTSNWYDDGGYYVEFKDRWGQYRYWKEINEPGSILKNVDGQWKALDPEGKYVDDLTLEDIRSRNVTKNFREMSQL